MIDLGEWAGLVCGMVSAFAGYWSIAYSVNRRKILAGPGWSDNANRLVTRAVEKVTDHLTDDDVDWLNRQLTRVDLPQAFGLSRKPPPPPGPGSVATMIHRGMLTPNEGRDLLWCEVCERSAQNVRDGHALCHPCLSSLDLFGKW